MKRKRYGWIPYLALALLVVGALYNFFQVTVLPFTDLPNHLAEATVFKHASDPGNRLSEYFESHLTPLTPNTLHILFFSAFGNVETGARVFYSVYVVLLALAFALLSSVVAADPWLTLLSVALLFNYNTMMGFSGYTMAIPLLLFLFMLLVLHNERPTRAKAALIIVSTTLIYYSHAQAFLFSLLVATVFIAASGRRTLRHLCYMAVPFIPSIMLLLLWLASGEEFAGGTPLGPYLLDYYRSEYLPDLWSRLKLFPRLDTMTFSAGGMWTSLLVAAFVAGALLTGLLAAVRRSIDFGRKKAVLAFLACSVLCYLLAPGNIPEQGFIFHRFSVFVLTASLLCLGVACSRRVKTPLRIAAVLLSMLVVVRSWEFFNDFERWPGSDISVIRSIPSDKTLSAVVDEPYYRGVPCLMHVHNYHIVWNRGVANSKMIEYRFGAIRPAPAARRLPRYEAWVNENTDVETLLSRSADADFLLVHGERPLRAIAGDSRWKEFRASGQWRVFEAR